VFLINVLTTFLSIEATIDTDHISQPEITFIQRIKATTSSQSPQKQPVITIDDDDEDDQQTNRQPSWKQSNSMKIEALISKKD
jgi:hypothetical protein